MFARRSWLFAAVLGLAVLTGCGESGPPRVKFSGKVTNGGKPLAVGAGVTARIAFIPVSVPGASADPQTTSLTPEGAFKIIGTQGNGVLFGKYKVTVELLRGLSDDQLKGKYNAQNSTIEREITATTTDVEIDLAKPNG